MVVKSLDKVGEGAISFGREIWAVTALIYDTFVAFFTTGKRRYTSLMRQMVSQVLFTGVEAFWLVGGIAMLFGITVVIQGTTRMPQFGVGDYFGELLVLLVVKEFGPFFTSIVIIGRSGSALSTYIAGMKVNREIAALEVMGIEPVRFLVMPAFIGMVISMLSLSIYFSVIAILGGLLVASLTVNVPFGIFFGKVLEALTLQDVLVAFGKNILFGIIIAALSCYHGLQAVTMRDIPKSARKAVVWSMVTAMLLNVFVTIVGVILGKYAT